MFQVNEHTVNRLKEKLQNTFDGVVLSESRSYDIPEFVIRKDSIIQVLKFLYDDEELQFRFLTTLCGIHFPDRSELGIVYHLHSFKNNLRIRLKSFTPEEDPVFPTATGIFSAANWMERETYDFFGITFTGHPNMKRILNMDEMTDFPLLKGFPLEDKTREDKNDKMFGR